LSRDIQIVFPEFHQPIIEGKSIDEYVHKTATLCILGPTQVQSKKGIGKRILTKKSALQINKGAIIRAIIQHGFEVRYEKSYTFRPDEVESLYIKHRNDDFFRSVIDAYTT